MGVLTELGLGERLTRMGIATTEIRFCDKHGTVLFTEPRGLAGDYPHPQISVHRGQLQLMLLDAVCNRQIGCTGRECGCGAAPRMSARSSPGRPWSSRMMTPITNSSPTRSAIAP
ncbi:flavin-containing monooxygenase [Mycobacteroides abscessus subsp. abscessus]|nr:flavin-containing monooxygenase [Mycobacteroides abscessus subsp. abscessus]